MPAKLTRAMVELWVAEQLLAGYSVTLLVYDSHAITAAAYSSPDDRGMRWIDWSGVRCQDPWLGADEVRCITCGLAPREHVPPLKKRLDTVGESITADELIDRVVAAVIH